jgi:hypothetical protein
MAQSNLTFDFNGQQIQYFSHSYNQTLNNERCVEVAIAMHLIRARTINLSRMLEIGAVLPHYLPVWETANRWTCIDLNEEFYGVVNADVLTWQTPYLYDFIVSISTLEHLRNPQEFYDALDRTKSWLAPGGTILITEPWGFQPWMDRILFNAVFLDNIEVYRYDRLGQTEWVYVPDDSEPNRGPYNEEYPFANTVYILIYQDGRTNG